MSSIISFPIWGCFLIAPSSRSARGPGLASTDSGTASMPRSCRRALSSRTISCSSARPISFPIAFARLATRRVRPLVWAALFSMAWTTMVIVSMCERYSCRFLCWRWDTSRAPVSRRRELSSRMIR